MNINYIIQKNYLVSRLYSSSTSDLQYLVSLSIQVSESCRLIGQEKDCMVVKYATAEQTCIGLRASASRAESLNRELHKEKELAGSRLRSTLHDKQKVLDRLDTKVCCGQSLCCLRHNAPYGKRCKSKQVEYIIPLYIVNSITNIIK